MFFIAILFLQIRRSGDMRTGLVIAIVITGLVLFSSICVLCPLDGGNIKGQQITPNRAPVMVDPGMWISDNDAYFSVTYRDQDGDKGEVTVFIDDSPVELVTYDNDAIEGLYYEMYVSASEVDDYTEFYYVANDQNGSEITLNDEYGDPFLVGDFDGWGEPPVLTNPDVYLDGNFWVFNVTYRDPEGDEAYYVAINIDEEYWYDMETTDPDPFEGQNFQVSIPNGVSTENSEFYIDAEDVRGSYADIYDYEGDYFNVADFLESDGNGGDGGDEGDGGGFGGISLPEGWGDPEVLVGLLALVGMAGAGGYGIYRSRKKRGRFSELLTKLDDIYNSFKTNPHKCEMELEKVRGIINEDLKRSVIDENNYNILKDRIDEIMQEIRSESLLAEVRDMPKDVEIKIKDMLIDGKITRAEYDKILPLIKGSEMDSGDKEKMEKTLESWVEKDKRSDGAR
jgi:hypothetical protein